MKDGKAFFFRIDLIELMDFATEPEGMQMSLLQFSKELKKGQSDHPAIQRIIDEAHNYIEKKKIAGSQGGKAKRSSATAVLSSAIAEPSTPLARSSNRSSNRSNTEPIEKPLSTDVDPLAIGERIEDKIKVPYELILAAYNKFCPSLPRVKELTDKRRTAIRLRHLKYIKHPTGPLEVLDTVFKKAEASDFLSGRDGKWTNCNFDWLMNESNMVKVIEGNYDNKPSGRKIVPLISFEQQKLDATKQAMADFVAIMENKEQEGGYNGF